ncbi:MAG TPA: GAF domain-containing protein, partial [Burkholderiales bacterium]|nr:GAF domain-containing protein [Burkholderiales bacterium]
MSRERALRKQALARENEALEQQAATSEILRVISNSPSDLQPVFDTIVRNFRALCGAAFAGVFTFDGKLVHNAGGLGFGPEQDRVRKAKYPVRVDDPSVISARTIMARAPVHIYDLLTDPNYDPKRAATLGHRRITGMPLLRDGVPLGAIVASWAEPGATPKRQEELLKTFADQAVIAIENVRLFNETKEALEQRTATAEILGVISGTPTDTQPVFEAIVRRATKLCESSYANVFRYDGERLHWVSSDGWPPHLLSALQSSYPRRPDRSRAAGRVILDKQPVHVEDTHSDPDYDRDLVSRLRYRRMLGVPLLRHGDVVGAITVGWADPGPIDRRHEEVLKTFAAQAVIAIENVRLFNETKEALEQQTAISEILRVISDSPTDVQPVLDAVAARAARICDATDARIFLVDGQSLRHAAGFGDVPIVVKLGETMPLNRGTAVGRAAIDRSPIHVDDMQAESPHEYPVSHELALQTGWRTVLAVPLLREGRSLGAITLRRMEVRPFGDKQITLLKTFADQAAIAIENARLFNETKEALKRQTATADILKVISSSPTTTQPVFESIVQKCHALYQDSRVALLLIDDGKLITSASTDDAFEPVPIDRKSGLGACVLDARTIHLPDLQAAAEQYPRLRQLGLKHGYRSGMFAPLLREGRSIGGISVLRRQSGAFSDKDVALLTTFADQAVIAIENARLFNETKEALERQTATSEILGVISSSPTDIAPVFDAILKNATELSGAHLGILNLRDGDGFRTVAQRSANAEFARYVFERGAFKPVGATARMMLERQAVQVPDIREGDAYRAGQVGTVKWIEMSGARSFLAVPLLKEGQVIGSISIYRPEVRPFSQEQVRLVSTFASQAVIAIENVRLFNETKGALEQQTAISEVLRVISNSPTDVEPVLRAVAERATRVCQA